MDEIRLRPNRQLQIAGLTVGIIGIKSDESDPEVMLGVFDPDSQQPRSFRLRPGQSATVAGRTLHVLAVHPEPGGSVTIATDAAASQAAGGGEPDEVQ